MAMLPTLLVSCQTRGELSWNAIAVISKSDCDVRRPELTARAKKLKATRGDVLDNIMLHRLATPRSLGLTPWPISFGW